MIIEKNLRLEDVKSVTSLSASTIWRLEKQGLFPRRYRISKRAVAWRASAVEAWIQNQFKKMEIKNEKTT